MAVDSAKRTIAIALIISLVCSILVSVAAVSLRPVQKKNMRLDMLRNILAAGEITAKKSEADKIFREQVTPVIVELSTGKYLAEDKYDNLLNTEEFNIKRVADHVHYGRAISPATDIADIKRMPNYMPIYLVKVKGEVEKIIFPVYGKGLWSTMYGFMALGSDLNVVKGFTFYEHGETPGLGGEVDNPRWKASWKGKRVFDENFNIKIQVIKGLVDPSGANAAFQIDGLSGATITTRGIDNLVRFWLGPEGYGKYFERLREGATDE